MDPNHPCTLLSPRCIRVEESSKRRCCDHLSESSINTSITPVSPCRYQGDPKMYAAMNLLQLGLKESLEMDVAIAKPVLQREKLSEYVLLLPEDMPSEMDVRLPSPSSVSLKEIRDADFCKESAFKIALKLFARKYGVENPNVKFLLGLDLSTFEATFLYEYCTLKGIRKEMLFVNVYLECLEAQYHLLNILV